MALNLLLLLLGCEAEAPTPTEPAPMSDADAQPEHPHDGPDAAARSHEGARDGEHHGGPRHGGAHEPDAGREHDHDHDHATMNHRFEDPEQWSKRFDDPARDAWQKPVELVEALHIAPGATVADIGAGTGYLSAHLARAVGPEGKVLALDIEPRLVEHMQKRAQEEGTPQVDAQLIEASGPELPPETSLVVLLDVYHHIDGRVLYFSRLLAPERRLVIVDFDPAVDTEQGPPAEHRLAPEKVVAELEEAGWSLVERPEILSLQYVLVFEPG